MKVWKYSSLIAIGLLFLSALLDAAMRHYGRATFEMALSIFNLVVFYEEFSKRKITLLLKFHDQKVVSAIQDENGEINVVTEPLA